MSYIKVGNRWFPDNQEFIGSGNDGIGPLYPGIAVDWLEKDQAAALIAWLSVPAHMAGVIAADDRDVMAWWQRQQETADHKKTVAQFKPGTLYRDKRDGVIYTAMHTFELDGDTNVFGQVVGGGEHEREWMSIEFCEVVTDVPAAD